MNTSDGITGCTIPECIADRGIEISLLAIVAAQYKVERSGPRTAAPPGPIPGSVAPVTPKFRSPRGDFEPVVADEEEVVRSPIQSSEIMLGGDVPVENIAKNLGWELGNVQKRVPGAFELDDSLLMLSDLFLQSAYGIGVAVHSIFRSCQHLQKR